MFVREKTINGYTYLYLVESVRENGRAKQRIIKNLGRKDAVLASGDLDRLAASVGRHAERAIVLQGIESGSPEFTPRRIGGPLLFGRPLQAVLRYRDLLQVETLFQAARATLDTPPIYHSSDAAIRGHVFC
jgi:hypothetical protein